MTPKPLDPELEKLQKRVVEAMSSATPHHDAARRKWERAYAAYRSYHELKEQHASAGSRDVDSVLREAQHTGFGADLFVPYVFSVIETTLPRMVDALPRLVPKPCEPAAEKNTDNVRTLLEHRQSKIAYPLVVADIGKSGLKYGLGTGKTTWDERTMRAKILQRPDVQERDRPAWVPGEVKRKKQGPVVECVDVFDWFWQPGAHDMDTLGWCIHRMWRDEAYVRRMFENKGANEKPLWTLPDGWDLEDALALGSTEKRSEVWSARDAAGGFGRASGETKGERVYEVWEFHDGDQVITLLGRYLPVQAGLNPFWHGRMPFHIFRPTKVLHEMCGIGEPEAIEDLQGEMNAMRSQRRDNATLVLQRPFAYFDGLGDPGEFEFGPGQMWPVDGDPRELIFPIPMQDIPFSSYQEEDRLQRDIERVTGIDDTVSGAGDSSQTATGTQLVQAAAGVRIKSKAKRLVREAVKTSSQDMLELYQQKLREKIYIPGEKTGTTWSSYQLGPEEIAGEFDVEVEDDSMMADNPAQRLEEASRAGLMFKDNPLVDQTKLIEYQLTRAGIENPQSWIVPQGPDPKQLALLDTLKQALVEQGMDPQVWDELVAGAAEHVDEQEAAQGEQPGESEQPQAAAEVPA